MKWMGFSNELQVLVALQAALTVIGNATMCIAAYRIYKSSRESSENFWIVCMRVSGSSMYSWMKVLVFGKLSFMGLGQYEKSPLIYKNILSDKDGIHKIYLRSLITWVHIRSWSQSLGVSNCLLFSVTG